MTKVLLTSAKSKACYLHSRQNMLIIANISRTSSFCVHKSRGMATINLIGLATHLTNLIHSISI